MELTMWYMCGWYIEVIQVGIIGEINERISWRKGQNKSNNQYE
jgi:hypothetical protein